MPSQMELLQEAGKRGILPPDKQALYAEAEKRGLFNQKPTSYGTVGIYDPNNLPRKDYPMMENLGKGADAAAAGLASVFNKPAKGLQNITGIGDVQSNEAYQKKAMEGHPIASGAGKIAGGMLIPGGPGTAGTIYGYLTSESKTLEGQAVDAVIGGITGKLMDLTMKGAGKLMGKIAKGGGGSAKSIRQAAEDAYTASEQAGLVVKPQAFSDMIDQANVDIYKQGLRARLHPQTVSMMKTLAEDQAKGTPIKLSDIDLIRQDIGSAISKALRSGDNRDAKLLGVFRSHLDDFINNLSPDKVEAGDKNMAIGALRKAQELWGRYKKVDVIDGVFQRAQDQASSSYNGENFTNALRQQVKRVLNSPKLSAGFTEDEKIALRKVVRGNFLLNAARVIGRYTPTSLKGGAVVGGTAAAGHPYIAGAIGTAAYG